MQPIKIIEIRPSKRFGGSWTIVEGHGIEPAYREKDRAISIARDRFGDGLGEIHVYDQTGEKIIDKIPVDGRRAGPT